MHKTLLLLIIPLAFSCSNDCSDCEQKLDMIMNSTSMPVNLPTPPEDNYQQDETMLEVGVTAENKYTLDGNTYEFIEAEPLILSSLNSTENETPKMKINGDKLADYAAVFRLIELCKVHEIKPILIFKYED